MKEEEQLKKKDKEALIDDLVRNMFLLFSTLFLGVVDKQHLNFKTSTHLVFQISSSKSVDEIVASHKPVKKPSLFFKAAESHVFKLVGYYSYSYSIYTKGWCIMRRVSCNYIIPDLDYKLDLGVETWSCENSS